MTERSAAKHYQQVAEGFDGKAFLYDAFGEDHEQLTRMRERVYAHIEAVQKPGGHLLELNAGTGLDASRLVSRGFRVHATDLAPEMVGQTRLKIEQLGLQGQLSVQQASFIDLSAVEGQFDGIYSNFGGLNCISDLRVVTKQLPRLLKPGGVVTWVIMPRFCPWELGLLMKDWRVATRRLRPGGVTAHVEGAYFTTSYFSATTTAKAFGTRFERVALEGLSIFSPTADNKTFAVNHPTMFRRLVQLDEAVCERWPFNQWGDFFILSMRFKG